MAWDSSRPVPWRRLVREWLVYAGIMVVLFAIFFRDSGLVGAIAGLVLSGPLYLGLGWVLAKLGYSRQRLRSPRAERRAAEQRTSETATAAPAARPRPAPTRRTSTGPSQRPVRKRR